MANCYVQIRCGNDVKNMTVGREYDFSMGEADSKISPTDLLNIIEKIVEEGLEQKFGEIHEI